MIYRSLKKEFLLLDDFSSFLQENYFPFSWAVTLYIHVDASGSCIYLGVSTLKEISRILGNPDRFRVILGGKFPGNICKHVGKHNFYGLKKQKTSSLA